MPEHPLKQYYSEIYSTYDRVNRIFTFGRDVHWRKRAARECLAASPEKVLDLCTGTGDFLIELAAQSDEPLDLTGYDFSRQMLDLAEKKTREKLSHRGSSEIRYIEGDARRIPFPDHHFDAIGITFGLRNLVYENRHAGKHLSEIVRMLKPGGRLIVLESSRPDNPIWRVFNTIYLQFILPLLGGIFSGHFAAYRYLARSSKNYYSISEMAEILENAGLRLEKGIPLFMGSVMLLAAARK